MLTLYAKNLAGDILPLSFPSSLSLRDEEVCQAISPEDPSCVRIVSRHRRVKEGNRKEEVGMEEEALRDIMDELHAMASEEMDEDEKEEEEDCHSEIGWMWEDGDTVEYLVEEQELTIHLTPPMGGPYYSVSDPEDRWPLYPFTIWVEREVKVGQGKEKRAIYSWSFLFSLRNGLYRIPSDYAMEVEGGGGDIYLALRHAGVWHPSVFDAIREDKGIPARYKEKMLRAVYRKWVRVLRNAGRRFSLEERGVQAMYATEEFQGEIALFKQYYQTLRTATRVIPH